MAALARDVRAVVKVESPVHTDRLVGTIAETGGIERMSLRARAEEYGWVTRDGDFLWSGRAGESSLDCYRMLNDDGVGQLRI